MALAHGVLNTRQNSHRVFTRLPIFERKDMAFFRNMKVPQTLNSVRSVFAELLYSGVVALSVSCRARSEVA